MSLTECPECGRYGIEWDGRAKIYHCLYNNCNYIRKHMDLKFKENHVSGGVSEITISEEKAITSAKKCAARPHMSDDDALAHFILMNRAYYEDD